MQVGVLLFTIEGYVRISTSHFEILYGDVR